MLAGLITALAAVVSDQASKALVFGFLAETQPVVAVTQRHRQEVTRGNRQCY